MYSTAHRATALEARVSDGGPSDGRSDGIRDERSFNELRAAHRSAGGIAWGDDLLRLLDDRKLDLSRPSLAQMMADDDLFSVEWCSARWIPMLQFRLDDLSLNPQVRQVRSELAATLDGWELASWFVARNAWLDQRRPLDLMSLQLPAVLRAARADRFVATW